MQGTHGCPVVLSPQILTYCRVSQKNDWLTLGILWGPSYPKKVKGYSYSTTKFMRSLSPAPVIGIRATFAQNFILAGGHSGQQLSSSQYRGNQLCMVMLVVVAVVAAAVAAAVVLYKQLLVQQCYYLWCRSFVVDAAAVLGIRRLLAHQTCLRENKAQTKPMFRMGARRKGGSKKQSC